MRAAALVCLVLLSPCWSRPAEEEESVVSVYTTVPTEVHHPHHVDVYRQIATNIAERITSPIYRFLGITHKKSSHESTTRSWTRIELVDDEDPSTKTPTTNKDPTSNDPSTNEISNRDVEELSEEALRKLDKKPEKIILYSSYLPVSGKLNDNATENATTDDDLADPIELDDVDVDDDDDAPQGRESGFVFFLELIGGYLQLLWGALSAIFRQSSSS